LLLATRVHSAFAITFALTVHRYVTAVIFPVVGRLSDRTTGRFGRRVPYMAIGLVVMAGAVWSLSVLPGYWLLGASLVLASIAACTRLRRVGAEQVLHAGGNHRARASVVIGLGSVLMMPPGLWVRGRVRPRSLAVAACVVGAALAAAHVLITQLALFV